MVNYFSFASKNLKRRGIRSWLTLLGIFIGIMAVVSLVTLGNGLKEAVNAQFGVSSTQVLTVQAGGLSYGSPGSTVANPLTKQDADAIEKLSAVEFVVPRNIELVETEYNDKTEFTYAVNLIEGLESEMYEVMDFEAESGRLLKSGELGKVVIGYNLAFADSNGFDKDIPVGKKILVEGEKFTVAGVLEKQGSFLLDNIILMYDDDLNSLLDYGDDVDIIAVMLKDKDLMNKTKSEIEKLLRDRRNVKIGEEDFEVSTPEGALDSVNSVLNAIQIFVIIIASISIIVGAIGIINTMATSVVERRREIGIMKSIGARNSHIALMFFTEAGLLGLVGGAAGIIFGLLIGFAGTYAINSYVGATTSPTINFAFIIFALLGSFMIGAVAGIVPALHAAKQNPVEALRE